MPCSGEEPGDASLSVNGYGFLEESTKNATCLLVVVSISVSHNIFDLFKLFQEQK